MPRPHPADIRTAPASKSTESSRAYESLQKWRLAAHFFSFVVPVLLTLSIATSDAASAFFLLLSVDSRGQPATHASSSTQVYRCTTARMTTFSGKLARLGKEKRENNQQLHKKTKMDTLTKPLYMPDNRHGPLGSLSNLIRISFLGSPGPHTGAVSETCLYSWYATCLIPKNRYMIDPAQCCVLRNYGVGPRIVDFNMTDLHQYDGSTHRAHARLLAVNEGGSRTYEVGVLVFYDAPHRAFGA